MAGDEGGGWWWVTGGEGDTGGQHLPLGEGGCSPSSWMVLGSQKFSGTKAFSSSRAVFS